MAFGERHRFTEAGFAALQDARATGAIRLSAISIWEVGMLDAKGRLDLFMPVAQWVKGALAGVSLEPLSPEVAILSSRLSGAFHYDPADRIIAATAQANGFRLLTADAKMLLYGSEGYLDAIRA